MGDVSQSIPGSAPRAQGCSRLDGGTRSAPCCAPPSNRCASPPSAPPSASAPLSPSSAPPSACASDPQSAAASAPPSDSVITNKRKHRGGGFMRRGGEIMLRG
eukprot:8087204-Pyramimonas_sp.AAC.1